MPLEPDKNNPFNNNRLVKFLRNKLLRVSQGKVLNDPYEFYPFGLDHLIISSLAPKNTQVTIEQLADGQQAFTGVLSFTSSKKNIPMWSHYADDHNGFVIEFDSENKFFKKIKPVNYTKNRPQSKETLSITDENSFFNKSIQWKYEKEWRIIESLYNCDYYIDSEKKIFEPNPKRVDNFPWKSPDMYFKEVPSESIVSITFGSRVKEEDISIIKLIITETHNLNHIKLYTTSLNTDNYELSFNKRQ